MAVIALSSFPEAGSLAKYDTALETEPKTKDQPARSSHRFDELPGGGCGVVDVWDSEAAFGKFREILMAVMQKVGLAGEPNIYSVHATMEPGAAARGPDAAGQGLSSSG